MKKIIAVILIIVVLMIFSVIGALTIKATGEQLSMLISITIAALLSKVIWSKITK